jgi:hypothetical protein
MKTLTTILRLTLVVFLYAVSGCPIRSLARTRNPIPSFSKFFTGVAIVTKHIMKNKEKQIL